MAGTATSAWYWLAQTVVGGGLLLLLARMLIARMTQPARRQLLAEWAVTAALLLPLLSLAPGWLVLAVPVEAMAPIASDTPPIIVAGKPNASVTPVPAWDDVTDFLPGIIPAPDTPSARPEPSPELFDPHHPAERRLEKASPAIEDPEPAGAIGFMRLRVPSLSELAGWGLMVYVVGGALLLGHWLFGHVALWRLLRLAQPAPLYLTRLLTEMTAPRPPPRLLVSRQVRVPFSCGLLRPTIVLPARLCEDFSASAIRWVLVHERTHLERSDAWAGLLFGLGRVVYFPLPWFWGLRRQVRLCQEYVADAVAAAAGPPEDYAEFLLAWTAAPAPPAGATGVFGHNSDLFRRITMLLQTSVPVERRCPRRWSFAAATGLLALAVLVAGIRLQADATPAPAPVKEDEPKKEKPAKDDSKKEETKKDQSKKEERVRPGAGRERPDPFGPDFEDVFKNWKGLDADELKKLQEQMEQARKEWQKASEQWRAARPGMTLGLNWGSQSRLGAVVRQPGEALIDQLDLPKGKGLVVESVQADSAAAKAGLKPHDILLELNGKPVTDNPHEFVKQLNDIKANAPVDAVVLRKGKKETIKVLTLPELKPAGAALDLGFPLNPPAGGFQPFPAGIPLNMPAGGFQPFPGGLIGAPDGKGSVLTTTLRNDDRFTTRHQEGTLVITVTGKMEAGKVKASEIQVQDGGKSEKYESVDKVPEQYRDKVKNLIEVTGKTRIDIHESSK